MTQTFKQTDSFKRALVVVKDAQSKEWNFVVEDFNFGWMPPVVQTTWTERYDVDEDGDSKGELSFARYIFEEKTPLAVRMAANKFLQQLKSQLECNKYRRNDNLYF